MVDGFVRRGIANAANAVMMLTLFAGALLSAGCVPGMARVKTIVPIVQAPPLQRDVGIYVMLDREGDDTFGAGSAADARVERKQSEIVVGYDRYYSADPFRAFQEFYRGAVRFELSDISALQSKAIDKATLSYQLMKSYVRDVNGTPEPLPGRISCATKLLMADHDWRELVHETGQDLSYRRFFGELLQALPKEPSGPAVFKIDVTKTVRKWIVGTEPNYGFVFAGDVEKVIPRQNDACATRYGNFALEVRYTVFP
jgi:hypothetical protein